MTAETTLARLEQTLARLETLVGVEPLAAPEPLAAGDLPPVVAAGELIQSAWGNAVRDELVRLRSEVFVPFTHAGVNTAAGGAFDLGSTTLGPFTYPVMMTAIVNFEYGFAGTPGIQIGFDIWRLSDGTVKASSAPMTAAAAANWYAASMTWVWAVPAGQAAGFKTRAHLLTATGQWAKSYGAYHIQRYAT